MQSTRDALGHILEPGVGTQSLHPVTEINSIFAATAKRDEEAEDGVYSVIIQTKIPADASSRASLAKRRVCYVKSFA